MNNSELKDFLELNNIQYETDFVEIQEVKKV